MAADIETFNELFPNKTADSAVAFWLDAADGLLDNVLKEESGPSPWDSATRERLTLLIARHLVADEPSVRRETVGDNTYQYESPSEVLRGLSETRWGRRALMLDTSGILSRLGKQRVQFGTFGIRSREVRLRHAEQAKPDL